LLLAAHLAATVGLAVLVVAERVACDQALRRSRLERATQLQSAQGARLLVRDRLGLVVITAQIRQRSALLLPVAAVVVVLTLLATLLLEALAVLEEAARSMVQERLALGLPVRVMLEELALILKELI